MSKLSTKERTIFKYLILAVAAGFLIIVAMLFSAIMAISPIFLIFSLYFFLLPGWLISRFFRLDYRGWLNQVLIYFILSLIFYLLVNLLAIFLGINIDQLLIIYYILLPILFVAALIFDLFTLKNQPDVVWSQIFIKENIVFLIPLILGAIIFLAVEAKGPDFNGDPYFHLSIIRKAVEGGRLDIQSLAFMKTKESAPTYVFPAFHILIALLAKVSSLNIFTTWAKLILPFLLFAFLAWFNLFRMIFQLKNLTVLSFCLFLIFLFYPQAGYFFQRIMVPDSLGRLVIAPIALGLALKYIFDFKISWKILLIFVFSLLSILIIHGMHYFYLLLILISFLIFYAILGFKIPDYSKIIKRNLIVLATAIIPIIVLGVILEIKSKIVSRTFGAFLQAPLGQITYEKFENFPLLYQYGYLLLPLILIFLAKKQTMVKKQGLIFILSGMLIAPIIYWTGLKNFFTRTLSIIFTDRLLVNTAWYYLVIGLILAFILILIERLIKRIFGNFSRLFNLVFGLLLILLVFWEIRSSAVSQMAAKFFSSDFIAEKMDQWGLAIFGSLFVISLAGMRLIKKEKIKEFFNFREFQNPPTGFLLILILSFILFSPSFTAISQHLKKSPFFQKTDYSQRAYSLTEIGNDQEVIDYIRTEIPAKSVFVADSIAIKPLAMETDQFIAYNLGSSLEKKLKKILEPSIADNEKETIIFSPKYAIDYIFLRLPDAQGGGYFGQHPELYQKVYDSKVQIYKVFK